MGIPVHSRVGHRPPRRAVALGSIALIVAAGLAGCSGGSSDSGSTETTGSATGLSTTTIPAGYATDFSAPRGAVIAHRGASGYAPEHTFAAYDLAVEQGADYLEQDLQLTADGQLVVLHDPTLDRTTRGPAEHCTGPVGEQTVADLQDCDAGTWFNEANPELADPAFADERIPTLPEVLARYPEDVRFYIELKTPEEQPGVEEALLKVLDEYEPNVDDATLPPIVIQSFSSTTLEHIHEVRPELPLVQLIAAGAPTIDDTMLDEIATYAVAIGPPKEAVTAELIAAAHERCLDVHPYSVNDPGEMETLLELGVRSMFTNNPDVLVQLQLQGELAPSLCPAPATNPGN